MSKKPSLRKRTVRILFLAAVLFLDYFFHHLFSLFRGERRRDAARRHLHRRSAIRFRETALALKGILIKLGQFISARVDLLPEEYTEELALLQDQVPPAPYEEIDRRIQEELGQPPDRLFDRFDPTPIASASLGQVHAAELDGRRLAVKVQYPGIHRIVEADLRALWIITRLLTRYIRNVRFDVLYNEFSKILHDELDYKKEGKNAERFRNQFSADSRIVVPEVIWSHTTSHVLTLTYLEGIKINQYDALEGAGISLEQIATLLVEAYIKQILQHRFFHGDPHPGNLFVQPPGKEGGSVRLVFVDFGLMQEVTPRIYGGIQQMMISIIDRDNRGIAMAMLDLGFISRTDNIRDLETVVTFFMDRYRDIAPQHLKEITITQIAQDLNTLFHVFPALQVPNQFILFARTAGMLNGLCSRLHPKLNIIELARPYAEQFIVQEGIIDRFMSKGREIAESLIDLPQALRRFLEVANSGQFKTEMHSKDLSGILTRIYRLAYRAFLTTVALVLFFFYTYLSPSLPPPERFFVLALMVVLTLALLWSFLREGKMP